MGATPAEGVYITVCSKLVLFIIISRRFTLINQRSRFCGVVFCMFLGQQYRAARVKPCWERVMNSGRKNYAY